jgi:hypothetical protein
LAHLQEAREVSEAASAAASKVAVVEAFEVTSAAVAVASAAIEVEAEAASAAAASATSQMDSMVPQMARPQDLVAVAAPAVEDSVGVVDSATVHHSKTDAEEAAVAAAVEVIANLLAHEVVTVTGTVKAAMATTSAAGEVEAATTSGSDHTRVAMATMLTVQTAPSAGTEWQRHLCFAGSLACCLLFHGFEFVLSLFAFFSYGKTSNFPGVEVSTRLDELPKTSSQGRKPDERGRRFCCIIILCSGKLSYTQS